MSVSKKSRKNVVKKDVFTQRQYDAVRMEGIKMITEAIQFATMNTNVLRSVTTAVNESKTLSEEDRVMCFESLGSFTKANTRSIETLSDVIADKVKNIPPYVNRRRSAIDEWQLEILSVVIDAFSWSTDAMTAILHISNLASIEVDELVVPEAYVNARTQKVV